jgi:hypothetical protein
LFGNQGIRTEKQRHSKRLSKKSTVQIHAIEETLFSNTRAVTGVTRLCDNKHGPTGWLRLRRSTLVGVLRLGSALYQGATSVAPIAPSERDRALAPVDFFAAK